MFSELLAKERKGSVSYKPDKMPWPCWLLLVLLMIGNGNAASKRVKMCLQPMISGRCFGQVESYAYNPLQRRCESFIYGGCGGNGNRFDTKAECEYSCRDI